MKGFLKGLALLSAAVILQVLASHRVPLLHRAVDLVLLVVVYYGSSGAWTGGMLAGAAGGLLEDVWFGDVMGIHGLTKSIIAYVLGGLGSRFDLSGPMARIVATLLGTLLDSAVEPVVLLGLGMPAAAPQAVDLGWRLAGNGLAAALVFSVVRRRVQVAA